MRKIIFGLFLFSLICALFVPSFSFAQKFDNAYLRLQNQGANSALSGTVCAQPSSSGAGTEAKIVVVFPSSFTISQTDSNWTTDTADLPAGSTAWPGISYTASNVSGKGVTFTNNDLTSDTLYCFNFTGATSTTGTAGNDQNGFITTQKSSGQAIDLTTYAVSITSSNKVNVTASVDPQISDLPITIDSLDSGSQFPQQTTLSYKITYGTNTAEAIPLTVQAQWSRGTIQGSPSPSVDLLDYVIGSGSNGYGSTPAVVDTINRTITWTISSIPANTTNQTLTFKLKTNSSYTGASVVDFNILARSMSGSTVTPDKEINQSYLYESDLVSTSTPTPTSAPISSGTSTTSTPTPTSHLTPTPAIELPVFNEISVREISQDNAIIFVDTSTNSILTVKYGTSISALSKTLKTKVFEKQSLVALTGLAAQTDYYFKVFAKDENGREIGSDIFTFTTATPSIPALANINSLVATSNNNVFVNPAIEKGSKFPLVILPVNTIFELQFSLGRQTGIKSIQLIVRNIHVLGISSFGIEEVNASTDLVDMVETQPGVYTGKLASKPTPGLYEVFVRISDLNGNITEQKIADLRVTSKFTILEKGTKHPIENARILLYLYNQTLRIYQLISPEILPIPNPNYSLHDGTLKLVLPLGKYKAEITTLGYKHQNIQFEINKYSENYPTVLLQKDRFDVLNILKYYFFGFNDVLVANGKIFIGNLQDSLRFFDLVSVVILTTLILLALFAFSKRHSVPFSKLYSYFYYLLDKKARNEKYVHGVIYDENEKPIVGANVYLSDKITEEIIQSTKTNQNGEFYFKKTKSEYLIMATKVGFHPTPLLPYSEKTNLKFKINLRKADFAHDSFEKTKSFIESMVGLSFELLLLSSFLFEILFINTFGFIKTAPFLALSTFNLLLWLMHLNHKRSLSS